MVHYAHVSLADVAQIKLYMWESEAAMRKIPDFMCWESGKVLLGDGAMVTWQTADDVDVLVQDNGHSVATREFIYVVV